MPGTKSNKRDFVISRFQALYKEHWENKGKSGRQFAQEIKKILPETSVDTTYVSKWKSGKMSPRSYLPAIAQVLGVSIDEFRPQTHDDKYLYDREFADEIEAKLEAKAEDEYGIDLTLLKGLRNIVDFDGLFPIFSKLQPIKESWNSDDDDCFCINYEYKRQDFADKAKTTGKGLLQIQRDGQMLGLSEYDMKTLLELQFRIREYVERFFKYKQLEMKKGEAAVIL
ncbi:MAG: helix-turn-helix transcriptional regulator [Clostridia bacterium]|nr:helix-turn-helix transcriptional regulator [Clostridia bacterium]